jgi:hypothetical protein
MMALADRLVRWLTGHPRPLFGPPNLAELTIIVDADGKGYIFHDKSIEGNQEQLAVIATAIVRVGVWFAESHGLRLEQRPTKKGA